MSKRRQFQAIAVLSVESDLVRFSVLSSTDGREVATASKRLTLITDRTWEELARDRPEDHWSKTEYSVPAKPVTGDRTAVTDNDVTADRLTEDETKKIEPKKDEPTTGNATDKTPNPEDSTAAKQSEKDESTAKKSNESVTERPVTKQLQSDKSAITGRVTATPMTTALNDQRMMKNLSSHEKLLKDIDEKKDEKCKRRRAGGASYTQWLQQSQALVPGQVEQDPEAIWNAVEQVVSNGIDSMCRDGTPVTYIKSVAITNETGTLLAWDAETGVPLHNAIHWTDARMWANDGGRDGTAAAAAWLRGRSTAVKCAAGKCRLGTLDAWLLWKLTAGQTYVTDVTNASYTRMLDLAALRWDWDALRDADVPERAWPAIQQPNAVAVVLVGRLLGVTVHAVMARPSAALYGQRCVARGQVVVTMADRATVALGPCGRDELTRSTEGGPWHVVGYREYGSPTKRDRPRVVYGKLAISQANKVVCWLTNDLRLVSSPGECMDVYGSVGPHDRRDRTDDRRPHRPCVVSALNGLPDPPHGRADARLIVCGITADTGPEDLIAAAVDATCYGAVEAAECAAAGRVDTAFVDGPYSRFSAVLQRLSDVSGGRVIRTADEMAVRGVARMAAAVANVAFAEQQGAAAVAATHRPASTAAQRSEWADRWAKAVRRSYGWARTTSADGRLQTERVDDEFAEPAETTPAVNLFLRLINKFFKRD